jgi:hypothetical protein
MEVLYNEYFDFPLTDADMLRSSLCPSATPGSPPPIFHRNALFNRLGSGKLKWGRRLIIGKLEDWGLDSEKFALSVCRVLASGPIFAFPFLSLVPIAARWLLFHGSADFSTSHSID